MTWTLDSSVTLVAALFVCVGGCARYHFDTEPDADAGFVQDLGSQRELGVPEDGGADAGLAGPDGGSPVPQEGCADEQREGFVDDAMYPDIAGCSGAFDQPGVLVVAASACGGSGDDHPTRADGVGCNVADLCAVGWHVCASPADIVASGAATCDDAAPSSGLFFVTRVTGGGNGTCFDGPANDVFGCGSLGNANLEMACLPLNRYLDDGCAADPMATWVCPAGADEANLVVHTDASTGGALCCRD